jgi:two-component system, chemotaxis family, sensor kinase CheA
MAGLSTESLAAIGVVFFQECDEHLSRLKADLTALEAADADREAVTSAYRAVHSIKGGAGIFGFDTLVRFSEQFEAALAEVRDGRLDAAPQVLAVLRGAADGLAELVEAARADRPLAPARLAALVDALAAIAPRTAEPKAFDDLDFQPRPMTFRPLGPEDRWS